MIDVKILAKDKEEGGSANGTNTYTPAYIPPELSVKSINIGDAYLRYDGTNKALYVSDKNGSTMNFYAIGGIAALGQYSDKGKGEMNYDRLDAWQDYDASKAGYVLAAGLGYELNTRITALENGVIEGVATEDWVIKQGYLTAHQSLAGYATQNWVQQQGYLTSHQSLLDYATKAWTNNNFASKVHTHAWSDIIGKPTTLSGYGITDAYISNGVIRLGSQSITPITSHQSLTGYATESWVGSNYASKNHTHTVIINGVSKTISASGSAAIDLGSYLPLGGGAMSNTNVVANLNADLLDGVHLAGFGGHSGVMRSWSRSAYTSANQYFGNGNVVTFDPRGTGCRSENDTILSLGDTADRNTQLLVSWDRDGLYYRRITDPVNYGSWKRLAFLTDNVASATKLQTARTLWGQSFNGTDNVSGAMSGVTNINSLLYLSTNVGIGTSNPTEKLEVNGNLKASNLLTSTSDGAYIKIGNVYLMYDAANNAIKVCGANNTAANFYALGGVSALGYGVDGGGGGNNYDRLDAWENYDSTKNGWVLSALLGNDLNTRLTVLENGVAPISHTHAWSDITGKPTTLSGYGITDAYISNGVIRLGSQSITPITSHQSLTGYATESWVGSNYASKNHTHTVIINGVSKTISASGSAAIDLGSYLPLGGGAMSNTNVVANLNADLLDGVHLAGFGGHSGVMRSWGRSAYTSANQYFGNGNVVTIDPIGTGCLSENDTILSLGDLSIRNTQLLVSWNRDGLYYRRITEPVNYGSWKRLAFLTDNVASATKLQTARTIWGQSFDGSGNVSGRLSLDCNSIYWKEPGYGDQFAIVPAFSGINDSNILCFKSAVGDAGTTPDLSTKMVIAGYSGNVGIGTTSPSAKLDVNGNINASGTIHSTTGIYSEGYVSALGQNTSSDIRLKDVQGDVDLPIDMLANAPSKAFVWKGNKALGEQVGTIAQYWQKHLPQVVHDNNGYLAMQYDVAALLGVISVAKKVKSHEERIAELERENKELKKELKELKYERN